MGFFKNLFGFNKWENLLDERTMNIDIENIIPPKDPINHASDFADWVFDIEHPRTTESSDWAKYKSKLLAAGKMSHRRIDRLIREESSLKKRSEWDVIYIDNDSFGRRTYESSSLKIGDKPMRCRPDAVLQHKQTGEILIIEIKTTGLPEYRIPDIGWPNIQAQLWVYSWIDEWLSAPDVRLVGWVWRRVETRDVVQPVKTFQWNRENKQHHEDCMRLFEIYGGKFIQM